MPKYLRCRACDHRFAVNPSAEDIRCPSCGAFVPDTSTAFTPSPQRPSFGSDAVPSSGGSGCGVRAMVILVVVGGLIVLMCAGGIIGLWRWAVDPTAFPEQTEDYAVARPKFQTRLLKSAAAPQPGGKEIVPEGVTEIEYTSGKNKLVAWTDAPNAKANRSPAVLYLHLGFAFGIDDWDETHALRDAGFIVMIPMLRGENGLPGSFTMMYDEVDDVLAAADALAKQPNVDPARIYVAGHEVGGTLAMLAAMTSKRFRAAASFAGPTDVKKWSWGHQDKVPFDKMNPREYQMRSPLAFARSFKCPARLYYGDQDLLLAKSTRKTAELAKAAGQDVEAVSVPGSLEQSPADAMAACIRFFQQK